MKKLIFVVLLCVFSFILLAEENNVSLFVQPQDNGLYKVFYVDSEGSIISVKEAQDWNIFNKNFISEKYSKENNIIKSTGGFIPPHWGIGLSGALAGFYYAPSLTVAMFDLVNWGEPISFIVSSTIIWTGMFLGPVLLMDDMNLDRSIIPFCFYSYGMGPIDVLLIASDRDSVYGTEVVGIGDMLGYLYNGLGIYFMRNRGLEEKYGHAYGTAGIVGYTWGYTFGKAVNISDDYDATLTFATSLITRSLGLYGATKNWKTGDFYLSAMNNYVAILGVSEVVQNSSNMDMDFLIAQILTYSGTLYLTKNGVFSGKSFALIYGGAIVGGVVGGAISGIYAIKAGYYPHFPVVALSIFGGEYLTYRLLKNNVPEWFAEIDGGLYPQYNGVGFYMNF